MPILLARKDVERVFGMDLAMVAAREAFSALAKGDVQMPQRLAVQVPQHSGVQLTMPCYVESSDRQVLSVKVVSVFPNNVLQGESGTQAFLLLQDPATGALLAMMDAEHLTALRTGAGCALATDLLARPDTSVLSVFGSGPQAFAQALAMAKVRSIEKIYVCSRDEQRAQAFCERTCSTLGIPVECAAPQDAVQSSDLVCTATSSPTAVLKGEWLRPGTHINAIGAFRSDMAELDADAVRRCRIVVDEIAAAMAGAGDLIQAGVTPAEVVSLGELLSRGPTAREKDEITLFKSVGLAVQDAFAAQAAYSAAVEHGLGTTFDLD